MLHDFVQITLVHLLLIKDFSNGCKLTLTIPLKFRIF
jgi:hypothetical protein